MKHHEVHDLNLEKLVSHLDFIGEDREKIEWVMKDGLWMPDKSIKKNTLCDLIIVKYDGTGVPVELKRSKTNYSHAKHQIYSGRDFIINRLNKQCHYGKFVTYGTGRFENKILNF